MPHFWDSRCRSFPDAQDLRSYLKAELLQCNFSLSCYCMPLCPKVAAGCLACLVCVPYQIHVITNLQRHKALLQPGDALCVCSVKGMTDENSRLIRESKLAHERSAPLTMLPLPLLSAPCILAQLQESPAVDLPCSGNLRIPPRRAVTQFKCLLLGMDSA